MGAGVKSGECLATASKTTSVSMGEEGVGLSRRVRMGLQRKEHLPQPQGNWKTLDSFTDSLGICCLPAVCQALCKVPGVW